MESFNRIINNARGMVLPAVLAIVTLAVGSVSYFTIHLLPRLQDEKIKAEAVIHYRTFMSSINDYLLHGMRERWCLNVNANNETDLLLSNNCTGKPMEDIVTYKGNLERILWTGDNISPATETSRILGLNRDRVLKGKTTRTLTEEEVYPTNGKLIFKITDATLKDMTELHPLYIITKEVKDCITSVDIEIFQVKDVNNMSNGEERKIGITIKSNISRTRISCLALKEATSTSYYTFYPRKLHTFSLMKYGDLDAKLHNEFHGPVYLAGDLILPPPDFDKSKGSIFYNTLTLGVFNSGGGTGSSYRAGTIKTSTGSPYTFEERGHPYLSKQDSYPGFSGFLGGVRLDPTEDKGFYNLFNYTSTTSVDVTVLESCIEDSASQTTPSKNWGSKLLYNQLSSDPSAMSFKLSFTKRNRFNPDDEAPRVEQEPSHNIYRVNVPTPPSEVAAEGRVELRFGSEKFQATIGGGSSIDLSLRLSKFDLTTSKVENFLSNLSDVDRNNYKDIIPSSHILYSETAERNSFETATKNLIDKCEVKASQECENLLGFNKDCDDNTCDYNSEITEFNEKKQAFEVSLNTIKSRIDSATPVLVLKMVNVYEGASLVLNQKTLNFEFSDDWRYFQNLLKSRITDDLRITFEPFHYGYDYLPMKVKITGDEANAGEFYNQDNHNYESFQSNWRDADDNDLASAPTPILKMECPTGMGLADWDLDMSGSTNFAWNYANSPPGVSVDSNDHANLDQVTFNQGDPWEGFKDTTKAVVELCTVKKERTHVYGFYVCRDLVIEGGRSAPLYMIGTFIVKNLVQNETTYPVYWHSIWDAKSSDMIMNHLKASVPSCTNDLVTKTWKDLKTNPTLLGKIDACSAQDLVSNGPNNFSWTTVDPDIGIAHSGDAFTSQKVNRTQKWIIREDSRRDMIR